jgi:molecular chaperone GrpE
LEGVKMDEEIENVEGESQSKDEKDTEPDEDSPNEIDEQEKDKLICEYQDRLLRAQAEFQNYQKRIEREFAEFKTFANSKLIDDLLFIVDDFQNAISTECEGSDREFIKGFEMIYKNLLEVLEKEGLSEIEALNEKFDPFKHEAVDMVPTDEYPEHTILNVVQKGYKLKDKVLRPAKVQVSTQPKEVIEKKENEVQENDVEDEN